MRAVGRKDFMRMAAAFGAASVGMLETYGKDLAHMKKTDLKTLTREDVMELIGRQWMLVTAGTVEKFNTMTASWGGLGWLWNKPVAFVFIRPERYTHDFVEREGRLTLSFYDETYRKTLQFCGTKSGRDVDKPKETGLVPEALASGAMTFAQARLTLDCRKLFKTSMTAQNFVDREILGSCYSDKPGGSFHDIYVVEIESVYVG